MKRHKYAIIIVDDEQKYWTEDYKSLSSTAKTIRYEFENKHQLIEGYNILEYEGYWYFLIDENNNTLISGSFNGDDCECVEEL